MICWCRGKEFFCRRQPDLHGGLDIDMMAGEFPEHGADGQICRLPEADVVGAGNMGSRPR